jgi:hypothetical protein
MYVESVVCPATQIDAFLRGSRSLGFGALALRANTIREPVVFLCERAFSQRIYSKAEAGKVLVSRFLVEIFLKRFLNLFFPNFTHLHATTPLLFLGVLVLIAIACIRCFTFTCVSACTVC